VPENIEPLITPGIKSSSRHGSTENAAVDHDFVLGLDMYSDSAKVTSLNPKGKSKGKGKGRTSEIAELSDSFENLCQSLPESPACLRGDYDCGGFGIESEDDINCDECCSAKYCSSESGLLSTEESSCCTDDGHGKKSQCNTCNSPSKNIQMLHRLIDEEARGHGISQKELLELLVAQIMSNPASGSPAIDTGMHDAQVPAGTEGVQNNQRSRLDEDGWPVFTEEESQRSGLFWDKLPESSHVVKKPSCVEAASGAQAPELATAKEDSQEVPEKTAKQETQAGVLSDQRGVTTRAEVVIHLGISFKVSQNVRTKKHHCSLLTPQFSGPNTGNLYDHVRNAVNTFLDQPDAKIPKCFVRGCHRDILCHKAETFTVCLKISSLADNGLSQTEYHEDFVNFQDGPITGEAEMRI